MSGVEQQSPSLTTWQERLDLILVELLPDPRDLPTGGKIIHDLLWGSQLYHPWEILLLDTPLCQRLRRISQLGMASLTFPSCTHHRFSHVLGVTSLASRLIRMLQEKSLVDPAFPPVSSRDIYTVRLAGLLHDIGHCFFSHASEQVLQSSVDPLRQKLQLPPCKVHEFFAWLILNHPRFNRWWNQFLRPLFPRPEDVPDPTEIAAMVVGVPLTDERRFLAGIISGPYDVDKLEYLYRDARMAGLEISYDIDRFLHKIQPFPTDNGTELVMDSGGVRAVEQLIFSRLMLFSFVYHHQKVLAGDALLEDLLSELLSGKDNCAFSISHPLDFLRYTDADLMALAAQGPSNRFTAIRNRLVHRDLPRRCLVLSREMISIPENEEEADQVWARLLKDLAGNPEVAREIRNSILERLRSAGHPGCGPDDLHLLLPRPPSLSGHFHAPVLLSNGKLVPMSRRIDLTGWEDSYARKKHHGYLFADPALVQCAGKFAVEVLFERYGIRFEG